MADVTIRLIGGFEVHVGGRVTSEAAWDRRRPMEVVQFLALAPGHSLTRDQVIEALWPRLDASAGAANLRKAAHLARQVLGSADAVVLKAGQVRLFPEAGVVTDLDRFAEVASRALTSADAADCLAAADSVTGELLPGSLYETWTYEHRRRLQQTRLTLLRLAGAWERVVQLEPTDEASYQALMRSALADGQRSDVIRLFGQARHALATELGVRPSTDTVALYEQASEGLVVATPELIGRDQETRRVLAALRDVSHPPLGAVAVCGPAGIGKSAFCRHLGAAAADEGYVVHWTDTYGPDRPYDPLISVLYELAVDPREPLQSAPQNVRSVVASLTNVGLEAPPLDGPLSRHQVLGALTYLLRATADGRTSVLVVDDVHDADHASLEVLMHTTASVRDVIVVLGFRAETAPRALVQPLARLERMERALRITLRPLEPGPASDLVRRSAAAPLDHTTVERVVELGAGNPFALTELARCVDISAGELPQTTTDAITERLVGLDADTVAALRRLALSSTELDSAALVALTGVAEKAAFAVVDRALEAGVLVVSGDRYRFRHDLIQQSLTAGLPPHQRLIVHREAAQALETAGGEPSVIAQHWLSAGAPASALPWCIEAAESAMRVGAFRDTRRHLRPVLDHDPDHAEALRLDAEALDIVGDPLALSAYDRAIVAAAPEPTDDLVINRALVQIKQGDPSGGLEAMRGATPHSPRARLNEALAYAGAAVLGATDPALGTEKAAEVRRIALETGDRAGIVIAAWAHAAAAHARGELHDSVLKDLRETKDVPHLAVRVFDGFLCMTQRFLYGSRPYDEVIAFADDLTAEAEKLGAARGQAFGVALRGEAHLLSGNLTAAAQDLEMALDLHRQTGGAVGEAHALQSLAEVAHLSGSHDDAAIYVGDALDVARFTDIGFHLLDRIYGTRIRISDDPGRAAAAVEEAETAVQGPLETCPGCRIHLAVPAAIAAARAGDIDRARSYQQTVKYLANVVMRLPAWYAAFAEVEANVAMAEGDPARARRSFEEAAQVYMSAEQPLDAARCRASMSVERSAGTVT
jgi:DNA-binding SARP family transcriptional activator